MNTVLFLCTGNYYRSRMAEELFNFWAELANIPWEAYSAGLREDMSKSPNEGPISKHAVRMLASDGYPISSSDRYPRSVSEEELDANDIIICMHRTEHEPMLHKRFPEYDGTTMYWEVPDVQYVDPEVAFKRVKREIRQLISILSSAHKEMIAHHD